MDSRSHGNDKTDGRRMTATPSSYFLSYLYKEPLHIPGPSLSLTGLRKSPFFSRRPVADPRPLTHKAGGLVSLDSHFLPLHKPEIAALGDPSPFQNPVQTRSSLGGGNPTKWKGKNETRPGMEKLMAWTGCGLSGKTWDPG